MSHTATHTCFIVEKSDPQDSYGRQVMEEAEEREPRQKLVCEGKLLPGLSRPKFRIGRGKGCE